MEDTLLVGDYIMINRFSYAPVSFELERRFLPVRPIRRGDVVVFKHPQQPELQYIKRVAGVPGDVVQLRDGALWVDGRPVDEPWVRDDYLLAGQTTEPVLVESGHYFMLGDHRNDSSDSRVWGQVPEGAIKGRALLIWWSFEERRPDPFPSLGERLRGWLSKVVHFFGRTRWERCFTVIR